MITNCCCVYYCRRWLSADPILSFVHFFFVFRAPTLTKLQALRRSSRQGVLAQHSHSRDQGERVLSTPPVVAPSFLPNRTARRALRLPRPSGRPPRGVVYFFLGSVALGSWIPCIPLWTHCGGPASSPESSQMGQRVKGVI